MYNVDRHNFALFGHLNTYLNLRAHFHSKKLKQIGILWPTYPPHLVKLVFERPTYEKYQTMTEAEHNWPNPKLFSNRPSASAAEVFGPINRPLKIS